jgi:hypothetical protein
VENSDDSFIPRNSQRRLGILLISIQLDYQSRINNNAGILNLSKAVARTALGVANSVAPMIPVMENQYEEFIAWCW